MAGTTLRQRLGKGGVALAALVAVFCLMPISATGQEANTESAVFSDAGATTCLGCHNAPEMLAIFRTPHGQQADPDSPMASAQCESCHGPAGEHSDRRIGPKHADIVVFGADAATPMSEAAYFSIGHVGFIGAEAARFEAAAVSALGQGADA